MADNTEVVISVGATLGIVSGEPATYDSVGFAALTYTTVGEVTDIPEFGGSAQVVEHTPLDTGIVSKLVGSINYGSSQVNLAVVSDAGQDAVKSGFDGANARTTHSVHINHPDVGDIYFTAKITSDVINLGDANTVTSGSFTLELTNKVLVV